MKKRALLLALVFLFVLAEPVLAYSMNFIVANTGAALTKQPVIASVNNSSLISNGLLSSTGLDSRVLYGATTLPHMIVDDKTIFVTDLSVSSSKTLTYSTGYSPPLSSFYIIPGYGGYITTADNATLEPVSNSQLDFSALIDTTRVGSFIFSKGGAIGLDEPTSGNLRAYIGGAGTATSAQQALQDLGWGLYSGSYTRIAERINSFSVGNNITKASWLLKKGGAGGAPTGTGYARVRKVSDDSIIGTLGTIDVSTIDGATPTWYDFTTALLMPTTEDIYPTFEYAGGDANNLVLAYYKSSNVFAGGYFCAYDGTWHDNSSVDTTFKLYWTPPVTITGTTASGEHTTSLIFPGWATGNTATFTGAANSVINCGALYASAADWWISFWLKPTATINPTTPGFLRAYGQYKDATHFNYAQFYSMTGTLEARSYRGGDAELTSTRTTWTGGTWYHVLISYSSITGGELRVNNTVEDSDANTNPVASGLDFIIGDRVAAGGSGFPGQIANVIIGTDILTPTEKTALSNGIAPGDETSYYYIDEGTGNTVYDYGSLASNGTKGAAVTWGTSTYTSGNTGRLYDFILRVNSSRWGVNVGGVSVINDSSNWTFGGLATPYFNYIKHTVNGTEVLWYQPISYISGTTLPNRDGGGGNPGVFTWGSNPGAVTVTLSSVSASPTAIAGTSSTSSSLLGAGDMPTEMPGMYPLTIDTSHIPGANIVNIPLQAANIPIVVFWIPVVYGSTTLVFFWVYGKTAGGTKRRPGNVAGQLLPSSMAAEVMLALWWMGGEGPNPGWSLWILPVFLLVSLMRANQFNWRG